jgi:hypothetical protein
MDAIFAEKGEYYYCPKCGDVKNTAYDEYCGCKSVVYMLQLERMTPQSNIRIWWDTSVSAYRMSSPFNRELVDGIKTSIPVSDRSYDPQSKIWTFVERQLAPLQAMLKLIGANATVITRQQTETASQSSPSAQRGKPLDTVIVEFVRLIPQECMLKAYRAAAMQLHPDRGGSMDKMSALNAAWDRLQKEVYGQAT